MHWLDAPPIVTLDLVPDGEGDARLVLSGPSSATRREGAVNAVGGVVMGLFGARFMRTPAPFLFPILFVAGGALALVVGAPKIVGHCRVVVGRDGVTFTWGLPLGPERSLHVDAVDVGWLGITARTWTVDNDHGGSDVQQDFVLTLHALDERVIPFECFSTRAAAEARRAQLERVLLRG